MHAAADNVPPETGDGFGRLMRSIAECWGRHDAMGAARCFHSDVVYSEGQGRPVVEGHANLLAHFERLSEFETIDMRWLALQFDQSRQTGTGKFAFSWPGGSITGTVEVLLEDGLVKLWQEELETPHYHSQK